MPRRPVNPQDRQRVVRACDSCKASKKRCDGVQPCSPCRKKSQDDTCHYTSGRRHHPLPQRNSISSQRQVSLEESHLGSDIHHPTGDTLLSPNSSWGIHDSGAISPGDISANYTQLRDQHRSGRLNDGTRESSSDVMGQPPVMLSSVSGEKVFVGNTAALSFLRFLQKTLERHVGPSCFTNAQESQGLFEADAIDMGSNSFYTGLSLEDKKTFVQAFFDASSGLLDLYSWEDVFEWLRTHESMNSNSGRSASRKLNSLEVASLYLMVAIGAQCCGLVPDHATRAAELFYYARKMAFENMLENPSLDLVRTFLLMAFYMFGACRRNSAFMYLGIASKAADILGLHTITQYKFLTTDARISRLRTAKSLRVFDIVCNSILGRPSSTPSFRSGRGNQSFEYINSDIDATYRALALEGTYNLAAVLDSAVTKSADGELQTEAAEDLVLALQQCSRNFPAVLRQPNNGAEPISRHVTIGNVHVSGLYYFSVILITRQFLIQQIVPQLYKQKQSPRAYRGRSSYDEPESEANARLADACIEAATYMAHMCHQVMSSGQFLGNMCILKAWVFATGLVLGFSLLVEDDRHNSQRRTAFLKSLHVLGMLKLLSPQAEQYHRILSSFHQTIKAYKEQVHRENRAPQANLVDLVFQPSFAPGIDESNMISTQLPSPETTEQDSLPADWPNDLSLDALGDMISIDPAICGENDVIMRMLWESDRYALDYPSCTIPDPPTRLDSPAQILDSLMS